MIKSSLSLTLFHKISFKERLIFCRICEFGCDGVGPDAPKCPEAGEAKGPEAAAGFRMAPTEAVEPSDLLGADVVVTGASPARLAVETLPEGVAESHGLLGMVPLKPEGDILMAGFTAGTFEKGGDFFGTRFLGKGCLLPKEPGGAAFFGAATATFSSARLSSFRAAKKTGCLAGQVP